MDPLIQENFLVFFNVLLEAFSKRDDSGKMADLYWNALKQIEPKQDEFYQAMTQLVNDPPPKLPSAGEIKSLIRQIRLEAALKLPPAKEVTRSLSYVDFRQNRIALLRGIYKHQGDTKFYRSMLQGNAGIYSAIAQQELAHAGMTLADLKVTHEDVTGLASEEAIVQSAPVATAPRIQPDRRFMADLAKQILPEVR